MLLVGAQWYEHLQWRNRLSSAAGERDELREQLGRLEVEPELKRSLVDQINGSQRVSDSALRVLIDLGDQLALHDTMQLMQLDWCQIGAIADCDDLSPTFDSIEFPFSETSKAWLVRLRGNPESEYQSRAADHAMYATWLQRLLEHPEFQLERVLQAPHSQIGEDNRSFDVLLRYQQTAHRL